MGELLKCCIVAFLKQGCNKEWPVQISGLDIGEKGHTLKKTPAERLNENILGALEGPLTALNYFSNAKISEAEYSHWGLEKTYGKQETQEALRAAHASAFLTVLKTPIPQLAEEINGSADRHSLTKMLKAREFKLLIPLDPGPGSETHLRLVLYVLSCLAPKLAASNPTGASPPQSPAR